MFLQGRLWIGYGSIPHVLRLSDAIEAQKAEYEKLVERNQRLALEVEALKKDPKAFEERARSELGMIKQNETFYLVVEPMR